MNLAGRWTDALLEMPLIAILRGIRPDEAVAIGTSLFEAGFRMVEVPLNSPDPLNSIESLAKSLGTRMLVGGGTVLAERQVAELDAVGGRFCVSPNGNPRVIGAARSRGMLSLPAFMTPTEAFSVIDAGAHAMKLFPADALGIKGLQNLIAVLPTEIPIFPVGGVDLENLKGYREAGAAGFGIGSAIYRPGDTPDRVFDKARAFADCFRVDN